MKRFIVTESERKNILKKYGLLLEQDESNTEMSSIVQQNVYNRYDPYVAAKKKYESDLVKYNSLIKDYQSKIERYEDQVAVYDLLEKVGTGEVSLFNTSNGIVKFNLGASKNFDISRLKKIQDEFKIDNLSGKCKNTETFDICANILSSFLVSITVGPKFMVVVRDEKIVDVINPKYPGTYSANYNPEIQDGIGLIPDKGTYEWVYYNINFQNECNNYNYYKSVRLNGRLMKFKPPVPPSEPTIELPIEPILKIDKNLKRVESECGITLVGKKDKSGFEYLETTTTGEKLGNYDNTKSTDWNIRQFCKQ